MVAGNEYNSCDIVGIRFLSHLDSYGKNKTINTKLQRFLQLFTDQIAHDINVFDDLRKTL